MDDIVIKVLLAIIGGAVSILTWAFQSWVRGAKQHREHQEARELAIEEGLRAVLRNELVRMHREWVEDKKNITLEGQEYVQKTYDAYSGLGGNDVGTRLYNDLMSLPLKEGR